MTPWTATRMGAPRQPLVDALIAGRRRLNETLDWLRFRVDTFPRSGPLRRVSSAGYQPLPWVQAPGRRADGTESRWAAIASLTGSLEIRSAMDIGCNLGYFTIRLAEAGIPTVGIERKATNYRTALFAINKTRTRKAAVLTLSLEPQTVDLLPSADLVLCLAVWHHLVHDHGEERANAMLATMWEHTRCALVFETGELDAPAEYGLPAMEPDPRTWIEAHLRDTCAGGEVVHLGQHSAPQPVGEGTCLRNLFAVVRRSERA
jgi:hypothetical protein